MLNWERQETNAGPKQDAFASQPFPRKPQDHFLYKSSALLFSYANLPKAEIALFVQVLTKDYRNVCGMRGSGEAERKNEKKKKSAANAKFLQIYMA